MNYYCTLFDSHYLTRGLAMYNSLINTRENFILYVFAFDDMTVEVLNGLNLTRIKVITLEEFETERLIEIKPSRTKVEYCWTCKPFIIEYVLNHFLVEEVTYVEADLYFYDKPEILLNEFREKNSDVLLTEHRYTPQYDQTEMSGTYCAQFMTFKNNQNGLHILKWWQDRCAEWCFYRFEDGKLGDQKYLDDWSERFRGVYILQNIGGGVAPWNIQQYKCTKGPKINDEKVIFYHFHGLTWLKPNKFDFSSYEISDEVIDFIYEPYFEGLKNSLKVIQNKYLRNFRKGFSINKKDLEAYIFKRMNRSSNPNNAKFILKNILGDKDGYVVFGAGDIGQKIFAWFKKENSPIKYFVDNSLIKQNQKMNNIPIQNPEILREEKGRVIIIISSGNYQKEMRKQVEQMGFNYQVDFFSFEEIKNLVIEKYINEKMKWIFAAPKYEGVIKK